MADTATNAAGSAFDTLTNPDEIKKLVESGLPPEAKASALFMAGDHWQDGGGWVGPIPDLDDPDYGITLELIKKAFTSRNAIKEIVKRHMRGVVGQEPVFGVAPREALAAGVQLSDADDKARGDIEAALTEWWDSRSAHLVIQKAVSNAQWASRGPLRLYIPSGLIGDGQLPKISDLATALKLVYLEAPDPMNAAIVVDEATKDSVGILLTEVDSKLHVELTYLAGTPTEAIGDTPRETILRTISGGDAGSAAPTPVILGGRITMFSIDRDLLVTTQLQQMQRAMNLAASMNPRNVVTGGFLERIILNALPPGHWETDTRGKKIRFVRETWQTGSGTTQWVRGIELPQKDGSVQLTTPTVHSRDPVDTKSADGAKRTIYQDMLEEADQAHILMASEALPSGKSRQEARADYEGSLTESQPPTNAAGRWLIETLLAFGELLTGTKILDKWRGQFEVRVNSGRVTVEERKQILAEREAGMLSDETAMGLLGTLDVQAELDRISSQDDYQLALVKRRADIMFVLFQAGASTDGAAELVGFTPAEAKKLLAGDTPPPSGTDPNGPAVVADPNNPDPNAPTPTPPSPAPKPAQGANGPNAAA